MKWPMISLLFLFQIFELHEKTIKEQHPTKLPVKWTRENSGTTTGTHPYCVKNWDQLFEPMKGVQPHIRFATRSLKGLEFIEEDNL